MRASLRRGVERHPLLWAALAVLGAVLAADGMPRVGGSVVCVAALGMALAGAWRMLFLAVALAGLGGWLHAWRVIPQRAEIKSLGDAGRPAELRGRVLGDPVTGGRGWSVLVDLEDAPGKVRWRGRGPAPLAGETIAGKGHLLPFPKPRNPGEFDAADWLFRQGAWAVFEANGLAERVKPAPAWMRMGLGVKAGFREAITAGLDPLGREALVIRAMVLGEHPDDDVLSEVFRRSGTLHAFSVSGLHVGMLGMIAWCALRLCRVPRAWAIPLIFAAMLGYAWLTGMKPPALRAATMAGVLLGGFLIRRRPDLLNALGFAFVAAVLADGHLIFQVGVQLSFGVVAAIGLATGWAAGAYAWIARPEPYLPRSLYGRWRSAWLKFRSRTVDALAVSTSAGIGSLPLTGWHFGLLAPISIPASTLLCPLVFLLMALAFLAGILAPVPGAAEVVNRGNFWLARSCIWVAQGFTAVPGGHFDLRRGRPTEDFLIVYDPGYGGGAACLHEGGHTVLFDTAHRPGFRRCVLSSVRGMALRPESMVLSHPDSGHIGGAADALDAFPIKRVLSPVERARGSSFRDLAAAAASRGIPMISGRPGIRYRISGHSWLEILHAPDPRDWSVVADERVMVVRLHWQGWRILFMSDAGLATERAMLESGADLGADVIVMSRHRQDSSAGDDFLAAVKPRAIIAGHADFPPEERVPPAWRRACEERGIRVFHQGECGAVTLVPGEDDSLELRGFVDGAMFVLHR